MELPHRPAVPLLGIDPQKLKSGSLRETHAPMLMTEPAVHNSVETAPQCPRLDACIEATVEAKTRMKGARGWGHGEGHRASVHLAAPAR